jgi:hypothetical protein
MSTAKQKAEDLYDNYLGCLIKNSNTYTKNGLIEEQSKQCALIAVNEIISALDEHQWQNRFVIEFYSEVKTEIEKL